MIRLARFHQELVGSYQLTSEPGRERPLSVELGGLGETLVPGLGGPIEVRGRIDAKELADDRAIEGRVELHPWLPFTARYELSFSSNDGSPLSLAAERRAELSNLVFSASRVKGRILDAERNPIGSFELRIDFRRDISRLVRA